MKRSGVIILFLIFTQFLCAQSLDELRLQRNKASKEIQYTNNLLSQAKKDEKASLNKLRLISNRIKQRNNLISSINSEINVLQEFIDDNRMVVKLLGEDLVKIKEEYAQMIRMAYKSRSTYDKILFLLSSEDFNQAYKRNLYLKQYADFRKNQSETLKAVQAILEEKAKGLEKQTDQKEQFINQKREENQKFLSEKQEQGKYIQNLKSKQRSLRQKLRNQRRVEQQLADAIQKIIEEEARKASKAGKTGFALTPEQKLIGDNFEQNKSRIPWPLERGIITEKFGVHKHPVLKNITIENNGIDITTQERAKARAVFKGEVSRVFGITGGNMAVIIRHGSYLSVYSNLQEVTVKKGDLVSAKQNIGTVYSDKKDGNKTILKFQIWRENKKLNPENWIAR